MLFLNRLLIVFLLLLNIKMVLLQQLYQTTNVFERLFDDTNTFYFNFTLNDITEILSEYDFIIIGAGSGGSVMANRLTEMHNWNVLLVEAGGEESMLTDVPLAAGLSIDTRYNWGYHSDPVPGACLGLLNGVCNWPKGRALGGTSVVNYLIHTRGNRRDYNEWASLGNNGWSYDEVLPYFRKLENMKVPELRNSKYHGKDGNVDIEESKYESKMFKSFIEAGQNFGYKFSNPNGAEQLGFSKAQATMRNGRRCSAAKAYLRNISHRPNLHISMKTWVTKILIDPKTKKAFGVELLKNKKRYRVYAKKEIILSAGAIASPQLLMLSGVGPKDHLQEFDIPVMSNLKVGYNLQDHVSLNGLTFTVNQPITIIQTELINPIYSFDYFFLGRGPLTVPGGAEGVAFVKTPNSSLPYDYPDIELVLGTGAISSDTLGSLRRLLGITEDFYNTVYRNIIGKHAFSIVPVLMRPKSRGRISLKSTNIFHWPKMQPNFYQNYEDMKVLIEGTKIAVAIGESKSFDRLGSKFHTRPFLGCENIAFRSDKYWECCIRNIASSLQHQVGTCKMGPSRDPDAVVNPQLQVYGIENLRVVDASIMPVIPASHTNSVVFMIAEKAADMVKQYWRSRI